MKLLALSDIHSNLVAVRHMRACEANTFDAIVVAGDIGNNAVPAFFEIMKSFACPAVYVFGNWDHKLDYTTQYGSAFHLLHLQVVTVGRMHFTGFSGCPTNWGRNPIARSKPPTNGSSAIPNSGKPILRGSMRCSTR